jgi:antitoxin ParD1/3/4
MEVSLTPELEQLVAERIESGMYASPSEVMGEALRLLKERDETRRARLEELRREIAIGLEQADRGETRPFDPEDLKRRVRARLSEERQAKRKRR